LSAGERLIWAGRPRRGIVVLRRDLLRMPFNVFVLAFAVFWEYSVFTLSRRALASPSASIFGLLMLAGGLYFVWFGLYNIAGRYVHDALLRARTYYGITDQRIVIRSTLGTTQLLSLDLDRVGPITVTPG